MGMPDKSKIPTVSETGKGSRTARGQPTFRQLKPLAEKNLQRSIELFERLHLFATGKNDPATKKPVEFTANQLTAARIIIDRSTPSLKSMEITFTDNTQKRSTQEIQTEVAMMFATNPALLDMALQRNPQLLDAYGVQPKAIGNTNTTQQIKPQQNQQVTRDDEVVIDKPQIFDVEAQEQGTKQAAQGDQGAAQGTKHEAIHEAQGKKLAASTIRVRDRR